MKLVLPLFLGLLTALIGIAPPGLINMTAAKISLQEGRTRAVVFALGATSIVLIQTFIAVLFSRFIDNDPKIIILFREIGLAVFLVLTFYFFWKANKIKPPNHVIKLKSKRSRFFLGMLLSALNFFPIPFYVFVSVTLATYDYFSFETPFILFFVLGSGIGSFVGFYCYIAFFKSLENKTSFMLKNINYIIGSITAVVSLITFINVIKFYFL